jgi:hypothetical protein
LRYFYGLNLMQYILHIFFLDEWNLYKPDTTSTYTPVKTGSTSTQQVEKKKPRYCYISVAEPATNPNKPKQTNSGRATYHTSSSCVRNRGCKWFWRTFLFLAQPKSYQVGLFRTEIGLVVNKWSGQDNL